MKSTVKGANNKIEEGAWKYGKRIDGLIEKGVDLQGKPIEEALKKLDREMGLTFSDHFDYQNLQARAHASGQLTTEEAQTVYIALGEVMSSKNGGWQPHVDLPMKVIITQLMAEILSIRIKEKRGEGR